MSANFYSVTDIAQRVGISAKTLRAWDRNGKYPARRLSEGHRGYRVYTDEDLEPLKVLSMAVTTRARKPFRGKRVKKEKK